MNNLDPKKILLNILKIIKDSSYYEPSLEKKVYFINDM